MALSKHNRSIKLHLNVFSKIHLIPSVNTITHCRDGTTPSAEKYNCSLNHVFLQNTNEIFVIKSQKILSTFRVSEHTAITAIDICLLSPDITNMVSGFLSPSFHFKWEEYYLNRRLWALLIKSTDLSYAFKNLWCTLHSLSVPETNSLMIQKRWISVGSTEIFLYGDKG